MDFVDGAANTILVVEIKNSTIRWDEPRDLRPEEILASYGSDQPNSLGSQHPAIFHAIFADGSVKVLPFTITPETLHWLLLRNDGNSVAVGDF